MSIKYAHVRKYNKDGSVSPNGGMTVAYEDLGNGCIKWAAAICSKKDNYSKQYGRTKSTGRLHAHEQYFIFEGTKQEFLTEMYGVNV